MATRRIRQLIIDSRDRINPNAPLEEPYTFILPNQIDGVKSVELLQGDIPMTMYNVDNTNNIIYLNDGSLKAIQVPVGNYTIFDFVDQIESSLNDASSIVFTVEYSIVSMKLTIIGDSPFYFAFSNTTNSLAYRMGFSNVDTSPNLTQTGQNVLNLSVPMYLNIIIPEFNFSTKSTNYNDNATFVLYNSCNNSDIHTWTPNSYCRQIVEILNDNIQTINVRIAEYNNRTVDLNGCHWSLLIGLNYCQ